MADFFNTPFLGDYFQYIVFFLIIWTVVQCAQGIVFETRLIATNQLLGMMVAIIIILMIGFRPPTGAYGDTVNYAAGFRNYAAHKDSLHWIWEKEWLFENMMRWFAKYSNIHAFFALCATVYVGSLWLAMRRIFGEYNYIPFLVIISMFTFWTYGVNGVRNGMAASLFTLAITYTDHLPVMLAIAFIGTGIHNTVLLMTAAALLCWFVNNSRIYMLVWGACILVSLAIGNQIQGWMAGFAYTIADDNKLTSYLTYSHQKMVSDGLVVSSSFRWDFILYSALGVATGAYFIMRRKFEDEYYQWIFNTFLVCNSFWILIIRAPYSNRFAQISWFIMPIVLIYPFMRKRFWINHERMVGLAILIFYAFGFFTNMLPLLTNLF